MLATTRPVCPDRAAANLQRTKPGRKHTHTEFTYAFYYGCTCMCMCIANGSIMCCMPPPAPTQLCGYASIHPSIHHLSARPTLLSSGHTHPPYMLSRSHPSTTAQTHTHRLTTRRRTFGKPSAIWNRSLVVGPALFVSDEDTSSSSSSSVSCSVLSSWRPGKCCW